MPDIVLLTKISNDVAPGTVTPTLSPVFEFTTDIIGRPERNFRIPRFFSLSLSFFSCARARAPFLFDSAIFSRTSGSIIRIGQPFLSSIVSPLRLLLITVMSVLASARYLFPNVMYPLLNYVILIPWPFYFGLE